ncbi:MAG: DNA-protecting protein DprA [Cereibacter sphaeroides]|uniref:DNA-protecting protein DprA n=1 Tax=Cereibacter sphaeroides TaxID=1063 RepID=A0A2W5SBT1_CERSP|nr:MAG: DNA-protecting protein DprA [Cereibacter sphaeroides]
MAEALFSSTTPFTPHTPEDDGSSWLRLIRSRRIGPATFHRLLAEHGSAASALAELPAIARAAGVENYAPCPIELVRHEMAQAHLAGARLLLWGGPDYPAGLMNLPDAPPVLWAQGDLSLLSRPMIALVGARNASSLGLRMARRLAQGLGEAGFVVVSGLARGIDAESHAAALETGTVAVQAGGVEVIYPEENAALAAEIAAKGCRLSEQPMGCQPQTRHFPLRNRIISGMAQAVVVVEAATRSGSLLTARHALDQGRDVLAVPGHPFDARAAGCNLLIRDGATLVRRAEDVIEALGHPKPARIAAVPQEPLPLHNASGPTGPLQHRILDRLGPSPMAEDQLIRDLDLPASVVSTELLTLELEGKIARQPGGLLSRTV